MALTKLSCPGLAFLYKKALTLLNYYAFPNKPGLGTL
jgi:hypothetical protein